MHREDIARATALPGVKLSIPEMNKADFINSIKTYIPNGSEELVAQWLIEHPTKLIIKNDRKTKLGDFRSAGSKSGINQITINGGLNPFSFLITLIHEFAHAEVFEQYGRRAQAHGKEWKNAYRDLMQKYFELSLFPEPLYSVLKKHMKNPKASSHADQHLVRALAQYDPEEKSKGIFLEELTEGAVFEVNGRKFIKGEKRRTRYMCFEYNGKRRYTVNALTEVKEVV